MKRELEFTGNKIMLGTCYYPEHWDESMWEPDMLRMLDAGIEVIRIAEFAWNIIEPAEGVFQYDFFDRFLEVAKKVGMKVIFCTPSATPPRWLTEKYPEALNCDIKGNKYYPGMRRHYTYNSPKFRELVARICDRYASHYAGHPNIIGWQIDNELNCETENFYSESDTIAFREFLKKKYGTLDELNRAWGTIVWNQTYTDWSEVFVPRNTIHNTTNQHQTLDFCRFVSDSVCSFAKMQAEIIEKYAKPGDFITTNGSFPNCDYHRMTEESLSFMTYDSYPDFAFCLGEDPNNSVDLNDRKWSRNLAEVRSASDNFGIMEQQSGACGWTSRMEAPTPRPGQLTLWTMQSIAHGADFISYFRWRTATIGTEIYWHGILDYSGRENRRLREVKDVHKKLQAISGVNSAKYQAKVAYIRDYDNIFDSQYDNFSKRVNDESYNGFFRASQITHTPMDYVYFTDSLSAADLKKYDLVVYPHAVILTRERMAVLEEYVKAGGKLLMGCRTGYKDMEGHCTMAYLPGEAAELTATDIPEYSFVAPDDEHCYADWDGVQVEAAIFNDVLAPLNDEAEILARYSNTYIAGEPALIRHKYGEGSAYYFGGAFSTETAKTFLEKLGVAETYGDVIEAPAEIEIAVRANETGEYLFVLNYMSHDMKIRLNREVADLYMGENASGEVTLRAYETKVYKI